LRRLKFFLLIAEKPLRVQDKRFPKKSRAKYHQITKKITILIKEENKLKSSELSDIEKTTRLAKITKKLTELYNERSKTRRDAEALVLKGKGASFENLKLLEEYETRKMVLEVENKILASNLNSFDDKLKGKMAVLSIPYEIHRKFPSTGAAGLNDEIQKLKGGGELEAKSAMEKYKTVWENTMTEAVFKG